MSYFKTLTYTLDLSQKDVELYLSTITKQKNVKNGVKKRDLTYKGNVDSTIFTIRRTGWYPLIKLRGTSTAISNSQTIMEIKAFLVWRNILVNGLLFLTVSSILFMLSFLLIQQNTFQGVIAFTIALFLGYGLFRNLLGRLRANFMKKSADLMHLLSVNQLYAEGN